MNGCPFTVSFFRRFFNDSVKSAFSASRISSSSTIFLLNSRVFKFPSKEPVIGLASMSRSLFRT
uniref:Uncharacterized protein n=1 Tax=Arundo donax TaxID=35708 RepID=A0A0A9DYF5_ARUDO